MRRVTLILAGAVVFVFALSNLSIAAVPQLINYQGVLADSTGAGLDTTVNITFTIYDDPSAGSVIWTEVQNITVVDGLFSALLGEDSFNPMQSSFFSNPLRYLGITVGADPEISPRTQLVSVPYSFNSEHASEADLATLALHADTADFADTAAFSVLAAIAEIAIYADSTRVADSVDGFRSEDWGGCKTALVVGAGPLGLLATALIRLAKANTYVADIVSEVSPKVHMAEHMDDHDLDASSKTPQERVVFRVGWGARTSNPGTEPSRPGPRPRRRRRPQPR